MKPTLKSPPYTSGEIPTGGNLPPSPLQGGDSSSINDSLCSKEILLEITNHINEKVRSIFDDVLMKRFEEILSLQESTLTENDIADRVNTVKEVQSRLTILINKDKAAYTYINLKIFKAISKIENAIHSLQLSAKSETEKRQFIEKIYLELFPSTVKRTERYEKINLAKINNIEKYSFLGIKRSIELRRAFKEFLEKDTSPDPIGKIISECNFIFKIEEDEDIEEFNKHIDICINRKVFDKNNIPITPQQIQYVTRKIGRISAKQAKAIQGSLKTGDSIHKASTLAISSSSRTGKLSVKLRTPAYNELNEKVLKLTDLIEDIVHFQDKPTYDLEYTKLNLVTLVHMLGELKEFWKLDFNKS